MKEYESRYLRLAQQDNFALDLEVFYPMEGITYRFKNDRPKKIEESGGEWKNISVMGKDGWHLANVSTKNMLLVGIFVRDKEVTIPQSTSYSEQYVVVSQYEPVVIEDLEVKEVKKEESKPEESKIEIAILKKEIPPPRPKIVTKTLFRLAEDTGPFCGGCKSSLKKKFFMKTKHCINPECSNFWKNYENR